jgi:hypothetical protein
MAAAVAVFSGCNAIFGVDDLDFTPGAPGGGGGAGAVADGGGGSGGRAGAGGGGGAVGGGGAGGEGGAGGTGTALTDRGLVARYYLDEAASGMAPTELVDAAQEPLALPIVWSAGLQYTEASTGRGLTWQPGANNPGRAQAPLGPEKSVLLGGSTQATLEAVVTITGPVADIPRIMQLSPPQATSGALSLRVADTSNPGADFMDTTGGASDLSAEWESPLLGSRAVLHVVIDTTAATPGERIKLYRDGLLAPAVVFSSLPIVPPEQNTALDVAGCDLVLGNRGTGDRPLDGTLHYFALYAVALTPAEVTANHALLSANDDTPP